ncbi:DUF349 domain-containing protein [Solicola gregarius]|uniref:DUF349 domain-containing protein n=1 Tax=Solicola gregarius TaxID=2908642 RepID=A0AA46TG93_9ACTN|nr:DUF349 domain-containing protein [Solicola gregarius]UYM04807.1 DUF349 domain-containing protein [Solicola gregarius]
MSTESSQWGRVGPDGTVYVKTADGERAVGQWPDGNPTEALAFYTRRYDGLALEVELLEKRIAGGSLAPDEAGKAVATVRTSITEAQAVGDLDGLLRRLDALAPSIEEQREQRKEAKAQRLAEARTAKEAIAERAETIATGNDWRKGADTLRELLDQWKALPRLDRSTDDALWHRFSSARTAYTRRRKAHFAEQHEQRHQAQGTKEKLCVEAESLQESTEWGPTSSRYRELMQQWKAAGSAPRGAEERLWKRFRAAQDVFFGARDAANRELDAEYEANAEVKRQILADAEALLPISDVDAARASWRDIADRWDAAGKVPRAQMRELEGRIRKVETAIRDAGDAEWKNTNPEARARASDTVDQLERSIAGMQADLEKAKNAGKDKRVRDLEESIAARESWLTEARKALADFS